MYRACHNQKKHTRGFTLIEMLLATGIFVVVVTVGVGAVLSVARAHRATAEIRQAVDTLYFVMEDITRNARLGTVFRTDPNSTTAQEFPLVSTDGVSGSLSLVFTNYLAPRTDTLYPNDPNYLYEYDIEQGQDQIGRIVKKTAEYPLGIRMTPATVDIDLTRSGFSVANSLGYPLITLRLYGNLKYQSTTIPFNIQTSISPRTR